MLEYPRSYAFTDSIESNMNVFKLFFLNDKENTKISSIKEITTRLVFL